MSKYAGERSFGHLGLRALCVILGTAGIATVARGQSLITARTAFMQHRFIDADREYRLVMQHGSLAD